MRNLNNEIKILKIVFCAIAVLTIIVGEIFSFVIAITQDAPGVVILGTTVTLIATLFIYGFGEIVITVKKNNATLIEIYNELISKNL